MADNTYNRVNMTNLTNMSSGEIMSMQHDAVLRVNEMQRIAKERIAQSANSGDHLVQQSNSVGADIIHPQNPPANSAQQNPPITAGVNFSDLTGFLDRLNLDPETIMLLMLIFLLINEGADQMLILALGYILL